MRTQYFEGVLQLRNTSAEVFDFVYSLIKSKPEVSIAKIEKEKNGIDIYLSSQKILQIIGKQLQKKFGGELKVTGRLHGISRTNGKKVYRVAVLFRMPLFGKGDTINYRGKKLKVLGLGKKVLCKDMKSGKNVSLSYGKLN